MLIYFGGAEIPGHRNLLSSAGVEAMALSYMGLRRRVKFARPWIIAEKFPASADVFLDSGAHTVNKADEDKYSQAELLDIAAHYREFVAQNIDRLAMVSEFDAIPLGLDWIRQEREEFWSQIPEDKFLPIWHPEFGLEELDNLARTYDRVGVPSTDLQGRNLIPALNGLVQQYGVKLHGVNMSKVDDMSAVKWDSISTISWISPSQYGDTIIWTGKELKRYPKKYKEQSRKRWRTHFTSNGFDADLIAQDDTNEVLRLSVWSWLQLAQNLDRMRPDGRVVTKGAEVLDGDFAQTGGSEVDTLPDSDDKNLPTLRLRDESERAILPVLGLEPVKGVSINPQSGENEERDILHVRTRSQSMRICRSCFLAAKCPAYDASSNCAYDIPVEIKSKDQFRSVVDALTEMQTQRVLFMKMAEDLEGGYADPNLSNEMDRLNKMLKTKAEMEQEGFSLKIEAKERGQMGMISRLFGKDAGESARALPAPVGVEDLSEEIGFIDAEVVEGQIE
jgi:hypothetical protein